MADNTAQQTPTPSRRVVDLLQKRRDELLNIWIKERLDSGDFREELISKKELRHQSRQIIDMLARSIQDAN